ncbi:hypothetical protein AB0J83_31035 [Actinoplanes sp. NPDC049596]|uniref:hypothetical protein n=1 Tax=unclassified Actinoplanes TaxID=2626549 RepID=UPI00343F8334
MFDTTTRAGRGWLPDADFLCVLFPPESGWETPPSVYLEIGQAVGANLPVLLVAEPPRRLDPALFSLQVARVPVTSALALTGQFKLFLESIGAPAPTGSVPQPIEPVAETSIAAIRGELANLREADYASNTSRVAWALESLALKLLRTAGAEAEEARSADGTGDIAAWVPGTEKYIPGPLVVETKIVRSSGLRKETLNGLQLYALTRDAPWSVLLYYRWDRGLKVRMPPGDWPAVMVFDIEELANRLQRASLAQVLNNERNVLVHRVGDR